MSSRNSTETDRAVRMFLLAVLLPPLAVAIVVGLGRHLIVNLVLFLAAIGFLLLVNAWAWVALAFLIVMINASIFHAMYLVLIK